MYRYFILIWNAHDVDAGACAAGIAEQLLATHGWSRVYAGQGAAAFHSGAGGAAPNTTILPAAGGAIFGRIFSMRGEAGWPAPLTAGFRFDEAEAGRIVRSQARRLFRTCWGRYVALIQDAANGDTWVLRDPSGGMPCLLCSYREVWLVFSDLEDCVRLDLISFSVNWAYVRALVVNAGLQTRDTALREVSEVQPGERVGFRAAAVRRSLEWDPVAVALTDPITEPEEAARQLRETTRACIQCWASCHRAVILNLSGGLDSSILLSCLRDALCDVEVTCLNYFGDPVEADERRYARLMAAHASAPLIERALDPRGIRLERVLSLRRSARPWFYLYELEHGAFEAELAAQRGAGALFSGAGGDSVFFQARADLAVADCLIRLGIDTRVLDAAIDAARICGRSVWSLLADALRMRICGTRWSALTMDRPVPTLVNKDVLRMVVQDARSAHPWFSGTATQDAPPGILWHALSIGSPPAYYSAFREGVEPERTLPLLSQPIVELCLRIPTYLWIQGGRDRAIARRAFASDLPPQIAARRNKGRIDRHVRGILDGNLQFVRDFLLRGRLVSERLLDGTVLELYLSRERSPADFQYIEILQHYLCVEAWLARWLDERKHPAQTLPPGLPSGDQADLPCFTGGLNTE